MFGQKLQTSQGTSGQKVSGQQFWALFGHILPRQEGSEMGHLKAYWARMAWLELSWHGKIMLQLR